MRLRKERLASAPRITVVVISRNEGANLRCTVENLDSTLNSDASIVVVDDGSTDASADRIARRGRIRLIRAKGLGVTRARNMGAQAARGDVVVFADGHLRLEPLWW